MNRISKERTKFLLHAALVLWAVVSILITVAIGYQLWWKRDRLLYAGKSEREQRSQIMERAGLNPKVADLAATALVTWPEEAEYTIQGDPNVISYIKYMLAPRIPSGGGDYTFRVSDDTVFVASGKETHPLEQNSAGARAFLGVLASIALIGGIGFLFHKVSRIAGMSIPEKYAAGMLVVCLLAVLSKAIFKSAAPGFVLSAMAGAAGLFLKGMETAKAVQSDRSKVHQRLNRLVVLMMAVVAASVTVGLLLSVTVGPDDWDAWAIWGPKAKVLALGNGPLVGVTNFGHADYPLLWPSLWAFSAWCAGGWEDVWCKAWGPLLLGLTAWQIAVAVRRRGGGALPAWGAAAAFAAIPKVVVVSSWSYAEAPFWLLGTCFFSRLVSDCCLKNRTDVILAGVFAAGAAMVKNEGVALALLGGIWVVFVSRWKGLLTYSLLILLLYIPWLLWVRMGLSLGSHSTDGIAINAERIKYAVARFWPVLERIFGMWSDWKQWGLLFPVILVGLSAAAIGGSRRKLVFLFVPVAALTISFTVILFHSADVAWQVDTAWDRLTLQAIPMLIIALAAALPRKGPAVEAHHGT